MHGRLQCDAVDLSRDLSTFVSCIIALVLQQGSSLVALVRNNRVVA